MYRCNLVNISCLLKRNDPDIIKYVRISILVIEKPVDHINWKLHRISIYCKVGKDFFAYCRKFVHSALFIKVLSSIWKYNTMYRIREELQRKEREGLLLLIRSLIQRKRSAFYGNYRSLFILQFMETMIHYLCKCWKTSFKILFILGHSIKTMSEIVYCYMNSSM